MRSWGADCCLLPVLAAECMCREPLTFSYCSAGRGAVSRCEVPPGERSWPLCSGGHRPGHSGESLHPTHSCLHCFQPPRPAIHVVRALTQHVAVSGLC